MDLREAVAGFGTDTTRYRPWHESPPAGLRLHGSTEGQQVWGEASRLDARVEIHFMGGSGHRVFLGEGLQGDVRIRLRRSRALVWIGRRGLLPGLEIDSWQDDDLVVVGNDVTTAGPNHWVSGGQAEPARPVLVIGDDCMFSRDIVLRNTDGHPLFDLPVQVQHNLPCAGLFIEPHVWFCQRAAVLKDVTVGACAIVGFNAVVTRDVPRFGIAQGMPATCTVRADRVWARATGEPSRLAARHWAERFAGPA